VGERRPGAGTEEIARLLRAGHSNAEVRRRIGGRPARIAAVRADLGLPQHPPGPRPRPLGGLWAVHAEPVSGGHLRWTGPVRNGTPVLTSGRQTTTAYRWAWRLRTGRDPEGPVRPGCGMPACVAPLHLTDTGQTSTDPVDQAVLAAGLAWLYDTVQPDGAILQHHGLGIADPAHNRYLNFVPTGGSSSRSAVVTDNVRRRVLVGPPTAWLLANPIEPDEPDRLSAMLAGLGLVVTDVWNGYPSDTVGVALDRPAHPTLTAAVDRYHRGCPRHGGSVFCSREGCIWYADGFALVVPPIAPGST
jgi:hypothetical protein